MAVANSLKRFFKNLLVQRNTKINKKHNGVAMATPIAINPEYNKSSSVYNTVMVIISPYLCSWRWSYCSNLGRYPPKKNPVKPP